MTERTKEKGYQKALELAGGDPNKISESHISGGSGFGRGGRVWRVTLKDQVIDVYPNGQVARMVGR